MYLDNIIDYSISKGKIRIMGRPFEYNYELYKYALILRSVGEGDEPLIFEFHDEGLICERKYNGHFVIKTNGRVFEMFCVSVDETNDLVEKMNIYSKRAKEFVNEFVIKKYAKERCVYVEITKKHNFKEEQTDKRKTKLFFDIDNTGLSFIMQYDEFMYVWLKKVQLYVEKDYETDNICFYRQIIFKVKDYQIDNYTKHCHYPIVLSPLSDKSYDMAFKNHFNIVAVINNFQKIADLYQVEVIYVNLSPLDLKFDNNFLEQLNMFFSKVRKCFDNQELKTEKSLNNYVKEIDQLKFIECNEIIASETRVHVKQICIDDIKICFSLKFDNIDLFLEQSSFLFLKPLIEELGLHILNLDSSLFSFKNYTKINIYQSSKDFTRTIMIYLFQQFISELIKALGGISTLTSIQFFESFNNNYLSGVNEHSFSFSKYRMKKSIRELCVSGYENVSNVIGSILSLITKMMGTINRLFTLLTFDDKYKKRRSYVGNKSIKGLIPGIKIASRLLFISVFYMFAQFYYVPKQYTKSFHWSFVIVISLLIIIIGLFWKPICGLFDFITKILETLGVCMNDVMADRVHMYVRYPRAILENNLKDYNPTDALASYINECIDVSNDKSKVEDICFAVPGFFEGKKVVVLLSLERLLVVERKREFGFKEVLLLHFSSLEVYADLPGAGSDANNKVIEKKDDYIWFKNDMRCGRVIEILSKNKSWWKLYGQKFEIGLYYMKESNYYSQRYDWFISKIMENKNELKEKFNN